MTLMTLEQIDAIEFHDHRTTGTLTIGLLEFRALRETARAAAVALERCDERDGVIRYLIRVMQTIEAWRQRIPPEHDPGPLGDKPLTTDHLVSQMAHVAALARLRIDEWRAGTWKPPGGDE